MLHFFKDILFPEYCISCKKEGSLLCFGCKNKIVKSPIFINEKRIACIKYDEKSLEVKLLHLCKYQFKEKALITLLKNWIILEELGKYLKELNIEVIISVPLHKKRYAERGFNQSDIIANYLGDYYKIPVKKLLTRKKNTVSQAKLLKKERIKNVENAFIMKKKCNYENIVIVDDVYTTGATMNACKEAIKKCSSSDLNIFYLTLFW